MHRAGCGRGWQSCCRRAASQHAVATASRKIAELETHLRTKLFDRSARKLTLTDAGLSYVAALKRILADLSEAERAASGEYNDPTGELVVIPRQSV